MPWSISQSHRSSIWIPSHSTSPHCTKLSSSHLDFVLADLTEGSLTGILIYTVICIQASRQACRTVGQSFYTLCRACLCPDEGLTSDSQKCLPKFNASVHRQADIPVWLLTLPHTNLICKFSNFRHADMAYWIEMWWLCSKTTRLQHTHMMELCECFCNLHKRLSWLRSRYDDLMVLHDAHQLNVRLTFASSFFFGRRPPYFAFCSCSCTLSISDLWHLNTCPNLKRFHISSISYKFHSPQIGNNSVDENS